MFCFVPKYFYTVEIELGSSSNRRIDREGWMMAVTRTCRVVALATLLALTAAMLSFAPLPAGAQGINRCGARATVVAGLERHYRETQTALGLTSHGRLIEVFVSPSGSWTIIQTSPQGMSCVVAAGSKWAQRDQPQEGPTI